MATGKQGRPPPGTKTRRPNRYHWGPHLPPRNYRNPFGGEDVTMSALARLSVVVVVLFFLIEGVSALQCYKCNTIDNEGCDKYPKGDKDPLSDSNYLETCADGDVCKTTEEKTRKYFWRGCISKCTAKETDKFATVCCNVDKCNGALRLTSATFTLITLTVTTFAVMKLLS